MGKKKHAKNGKAKESQEPFELELDFLDPAGFPDQRTVFAFAVGPGFDAMTAVVREALLPKQSSRVGDKDFPDGFLFAAREAASLLAGDLRNIAYALVAAPGREIVGVPGGAWNGNRGRSQLLALLLESGIDNDNWLAHYYRWLGTPASEDHTRTVLARVGAAEARV